MESRRLALILSVCVLSVAHLPHCFAKTIPPGSPDVVIITAAVEGHAGNFMLDTGAERSCLDTEFAAPLRRTSRSIASLRGPSSAQESTGVLLTDLRIGSFHLQNLAVFSTDLKAKFLRAGVSIDGIIGIDVLRQFVVTIDLARGTSEFRRKGQRPPRAGAVTLHYVDGAYFVPVSFQGIHTRLLLDTGANVTSLSFQAWSRITARWQPQLTLDGIRSTGSPMGTQLALVPRVSIGRSISRDLGVRVQPQTAGGLFSDVDFDGILGTDLLKNCLLTLDLGRDKMYLTHNPEPQSDPYLYSTIGIQFAKNADGAFTIMAVWDPSPAAIAGLKIGDLILGVNTHDAKQMSLDDLSRQVHGPEGTEVDLVVNSGGQRRIVPLATRCLLCPVIRVRQQPGSGK